MKGELLILFVILLLALILCSFLGGKGCIEGMENNSNDNTLLEKSSNDTISNGTTSTTTRGEIKGTNYDNYDHYNKTSYPSIFYGPQGKTGKIIQTPNNNTIVITNKNGTTEIYYIDKNSTTDPKDSTYYGTNGGSAKIITDTDGKQTIEITTPNGSKIVYGEDNVYDYNSQDDIINQYDVHYNTTGSDISASTYNGPYGGKATTVTGPAGNTYSSYDSSAYYNSLPQGIPRNQIPTGDEDLYILKSQVVPPVCPKCPSVIQQCPDNFDVTKCPPCPPCSRCPESPWECKKVPNYNAFNQNYMPVPVLTDFSGFGM
jgi:hypothetical protein